jgi:outer membrane phospholipase A
MTISHRSTPPLHISILATLIWLLIATPGFAAVSRVLSFAEQPLTAGTATEVRLYFHNDGNKDEMFISPQQIQFQMEDEDGRQQTLTAFNGSRESLTTLTPGQFFCHSYTLALPNDLTGTLSYNLADYTDISGIIRVDIAPPEQATTEAEGDIAQQARQTRSLPEFESLSRAYAANFFMHEPTYFLIGANPEDSRFQISFRYRLFNPSGSLSIKFPGMSGFNLAYTQASSWDLESESFPFEDTSYKPEFMYLTENIGFRPSWLDGLFIRTAFQHESNGRDGAESRSTNYFYLKPTFVFYNEATQLGMLISPKFLTYLNNNDETNPDLANYRGYVDLEMKIGKANSLMLTTNTGFASKGISFKTDLNYPISRLLKNNLDIYLQLQYSNVLAESLLTYQERSESLRIGIALSR